MTIATHRSSIATTSFLSLEKAEQEFRNSLAPMSLGQLKPLLASLVDISKKENFNLREVSINTKLKQAESISRIFFNVVKEKGLVQDLEKDSNWNPWRENIEWVCTQIDRIRQESDYGAVFPITWH